MTQISLLIIISICDFSVFLLTLFVFKAIHLFTIVLSLRPLVCVFLKISYFTFIRNLTHVVFIFLHRVQFIHIHNIIAYIFIYCIYNMCDIFAYNKCTIYHYIIEIIKIYFFYTCQAMALLLRF